MDVTAEWRGSCPEEGNLHPEHLAALLDVLERHTSTAGDCWFAVWDGWGADETAVWLRGTGPWRPAHHEVWWRRLLSGDVRRHRQPPDGPVQLPGRDYHLGRGPLRSALAIGELDTAESATQGGWWFIPRSPNLCWPDDHAWFVATEIDFDSTLVAGTRDLVDDLLAHDVLEAVEVAPGDALTVDADTVN